MKNFFQKRLPILFTFFGFILMCSSMNAQNPGEIAYVNKMVAKYTSFQSQHSVGTAKFDTYQVAIDYLNNTVVVGLSNPNYLDLNQDALDTKNHPSLRLCVELIMANYTATQLTDFQNTATQMQNAGEVPSSNYKLQMLQDILAVNAY